MTGRFEGKVALITGAGSGMGRAITRRLADEGASVLAVDVNAAGLDETRSLAPGVETRTVDVGDREACGAAVEAAVAQFGGLDVLGNVAGILIAGHVTDMTEAEYRRIMAVNLDGPFFLSQAALPHLLERSGNIVNIASNSGIHGIPYVAAYSMTKGGIIQLTRALAVEFIKTGLRVNAIAPAGTNTNIAQGTSFPPDLEIDLMVRMGGHRGMAEPEDIAGLFAYLASDDARAVHGAVYTIDHGLTIS